MRLDFDRRNSRNVKKNHGASLKEAQEIFDQVYVLAQKTDDPQQFRAIGYYDLITAWKAAYFTNKFTVFRSVRRVKLI